LTAVTIKLSQQNLTMNQTLREEKVRLQALLEINTTLVESDLDLQAIFGQISASLQKAVHHDFAAVAVLNEVKESFSG
jgi:hypothetical protein